MADNNHITIPLSHGDAFKVYIRVFTDEEISKRLNTLSDKIKSKKELSEIEVLDFAYILLFAQENKAKEYTKKVVDLFSEVKNLDYALQLDIHYVLKKLIRLHFRDDKTKTRELLTMITKAVHPNVLDSMTTLERMNKKVEFMQDELSKMDDELILKNDEIIKKDDEITRMDNEISKLKEKLKENNIQID